MKNAILPTLTIGLFVGLMTLGACHKSQVTGLEEYRDYSLDDFSKIELDLSQAEAVSDNDMIMGAPVMMARLNDSIIAIYDANNEELIWFLNVDNKRYTSCLRKGEGPEESLGISNIFVQEGKLFVSPSRDSKMFEISSEPTVKLALKTPEDVSRTIRISDTEMICAPLSADSVRFVKADINRVISDTIGNLDFIPGEGTFVPRNILAQMSIALSEDRNTLVAANLGWNIIEVYDLKNDNSLILRGPVQIDSKVVEVETPFGTTYRQKPRWEFFRNPSVSKDGFDVGYIGVEVSSSKDFDKKISSILCFDLNGTPTVRLGLSEEALCYLIDYDTMTLYYVPNNREPVIMKYDLPLSYKELTTPKK